jgi:hypothetical protein
MLAFSSRLRTRLPQHHQQFMDMIEGSLDSWEQRHARFMERAERAAAATAAAERQTARALITVQATNIAARMVGLADGFITLANADNTYAAPAVVRALHEQACVPCYMAREVIPRLRKQRVNDVQRLLFRLGLGTGPAAGFGNIRPIAVPALNSAAEKWIDDYLARAGSGAQSAKDITQMIYGPLSDQTHPNFGATGRAGGSPVVATLRPAFDEETIDNLLSATFFMLAVGGEAIDEVVAAAEGAPMEFGNSRPQWKDGDLYKPGEPDGAIGSGPLAET